MKLRISNPIHEVRGPGMTGRKLPAIPNKMKNPERQIKKRSISLSVGLVPKLESYNMKNK
jgi:hypothetical protein